MAIPVPIPPTPASTLTPQGTHAARPGADRLHRERERAIDEELAQSFPASDPPSWTMGVNLDKAPEPSADTAPQGRVGLPGGN